MGMDMLYRVFDLKDIETREGENKEGRPTGYVSGYISAFDNVEPDYNTRFRETAFKKTLKDRNGLFALLWMHVKEMPVGLAKLFTDSRGLGMEDGEIDLDIEPGRRVFSGIKRRYIDAFSHSFKALKTKKAEDGVLDILEARLYEASFVTRNFNANALAKITHVRAIEELEQLAIEHEGRSVISSNLSLASKDLSWDAGKARARVKAWADGDMSKYRKAFLWVGDDPENYTSYKFPIADVIDGGLKAVPRAIYAAAARIDQAKDVDIAGIKAQITKYYHKMGEKAPWERIIVPVGMAFQMGRLSALLREPPVGTQAGEPRRKPGDHLREFQEQITRIERALKGV